MKRIITADADSSPDFEDIISDRLGEVKDSFDYAIDGIQNLVVNGSVDNQRIHELVTSLHTSVNDIIDEIAELTLD